MTAGPPFSCKDFYGREISYQVIEFEGSPRDVFWGRYIEPFLEDIVDRSVNETLRLAKERSQNATEALSEVQNLLLSLAQNTYRRMSEVDRLLRGRGNPESVPNRDSSSELNATERFIEQRINTEKAMYKPKLWINEFYNEHTFLFWLLALVLGGVISVIVA